MKIQAVILASMLSLILTTTANASAPLGKNYDVFIEAEDPIATYGFGVVGPPRSLGYSGRKMLNLWQLTAPKPPGYYAKYACQIAKYGRYYIIIWVQDLKTSYSSPFQLIVDGQEWVLNKNTAKTLPKQIKYGGDITGYYIGPVALRAGTHNIAIIVNQRRAYSDKAYNLLVDALALNLNNPTSLEAPQKVFLTVDPTHELGTFCPLTDLSQGGISEVTNPVFWRSVAPILTHLRTSLVRIDHIFDDDFYHVVQKRADGSYEYDWERLDAVISEIFETGANPFLCLSYMPKTMSRDNTPYQAPTNINDWRVLCEDLVRHMKTRFNLTGLYYEVWNEPDLKRFWKGSEEDYLSLYQASADAIKSIDPSAKVGGPAVASLVMGWTKPFLKYVKSRDLPLDFVSWHLYNQDPATYSQQIQYLRHTLVTLAFPNSVEMILTEWNSSGHLDPANDAFYNAGRTAAVLAVLHNESVSKAFFFAPKDYLDSQLLYGGWGLVAYDGTPKPSYDCLDAYSHLRDGQQIKISSTDAGVNAFGVIDVTTLKLFLWNYSDEQAFGQPREIQIVLKLQGTPLGSGEINQKKYLIDSQHSNITINPKNPSLQLVSSNVLKSKGIIREQISLENGAVMYIELTIRVVSSFLCKFFISQFLKEWQVLTHFSYRV